MKRWPSDETKTVDYEQIMDPLLDLYKRCKKNPDLDHEYDGYELGPQTAATCLDGEHLGEAKTREWVINNNGRTLLELFMNLSFQLGMEQGRRLYKKNGC